MRKVFRASKLLLCLLVWGMLSTGVSRATHIVGGELNYAYLGGNNYRVTLQLYKDCGLSIVPFDNPATIYVYDGNNQFAFSFEMPIVQRDTLDAAFRDTCLLIPPEVCVDYARYEATVALTPNMGGYSLAYIRCCRNATILNAIGRDQFGNPLTPDLIGATYWVRVPPGNSGNSNPVFREFPPIILCSGQSIDGDHSAVDTDGDSLVYSLCTPNVGGALTAVFGNPQTDRPPFTPVEWVPPYGLSNIMGGDPPLRINPVTGRLTGRAPEVIGQFVVGVCVREYRNGVLLSENKRDFQFNIADCRKRIIADYELTGGFSIDTLVVEEPNHTFSYVLVCDSVPAVQFVNQTEGTGFTVWDFGDGSPEVLADDPYHVFPDTGFYLVSLYGAPGNVCSDTFRQLISIQYQNVDAAFRYADPFCVDPSVGLAFIDESEDADAIGTWAWDFGDGSSSSAADPVHFYAENGTYDVHLEITGRNGCRSSLDTTLEVFLLEPFTLPDTAALCGEPSTVLPLEISGDHTFTWSPAASLDDPSAQQPLASPEVNTVYTVEILTVRPTGDTCRRTAQIAVLPDYGKPSLVQQTDGLQCTADVALSVASDAGAAISWSLNGNFNPVFSTQASVTTPQLAADVVYYVRSENAFCLTVDTVLVRQRAVVLEPDPPEICLGDSAVLRVEATSFDPDITYTWTIGSETVVTAVPQLVIRPEGPVIATVGAMNRSGCSDEAVLPVVVNPLPEFGVSAFPESVINSQEVQFQATFDPAYEYLWQPDALFQGAGEDDPAAVVSESMYIYVTVTDANGCMRRDSIFIPVEDIPCAEPQIFVPNAFSPNGDALNDAFRVQGVVIESLHLEIYDRWGNTVFEGHAPEETWDGTFRGGLLGNDTFGYALRIQCFGGGTFVKQGSITLVR